MINFMKESRPADRRLSSKDGQREMETAVKQVYISLQIPLDASFSIYFYMAFFLKRGGGIRNKLVLTEIKSPN